MNKKSLPDTLQRIWAISEAIAEQLSIVEDNLRNNSLPDETGYLQYVANLVSANRDRALRIQELMKNE